ENAESALETLRSEGEGSASIVELQRLLHTLKGGARMAGVTPMGDLSHALETLLAGMADKRVAPSPGTLELLQQCLDTLSEMRDSIDAGRPVSSAADLVTRIEALSSPGGDGMGAAQAGAEAAGADPGGPAEQADADAARTAEGEAGSGEEPTVRQLAPTLPPGDDDHAATDTLASGAETADEASAAPSDDASAASAAPAATDKGFRRTVPGLDELARRLTRFKRGAEPKTPPPPAPESPAADAAEPPSDGADEAAAAAAQSDDAAASAAQAASVEHGAAAEHKDAGAAGPSDAPARGPQAEGRGAERAETARVDAALLDALLNGAGEINIFQSRLNQQLHSIDFHLGELGQTVTRLREQLRKLEAETEAQILYRHQDDLTAGGQGFDPLELDRYSTIQQLSRALAETASDVASINELLHGLTSEAETLLSQQARVTSELQEGLMRTRMVPFQRHSSRLARIVRQAASDTHKLAELVVQGGGSEVDRQVLDTMLAPFEHLLRNAVVHGIEPPAERREAGKPETGHIELSLRREGAEVRIAVADDGGGLDLAAIRRKAFEQGLIADPQQISDNEAVELILRPGFSTASELTQAAGRGVGMDVVDNEIKKLGGSMRIESAKGRGTRFFIRLPYTLAVTHALIGDAGEETFALPLPTIEGVTRVPRETLLDLLTRDEPKLEYGGVTYRIQHLGSLVGGMPSALPAEEGAVSLVLVRAGEHSTALLTDALEGS